MAMGSVRITKPLRRLIYINGNYDEAAGLSPGPFAVELGNNTFETLDGSGNVDWTGAATLTAANPNVSLALQPVS